MKEKHEKGKNQQKFWIERQFRTAGLLPSFTQTEPKTHIACSSYANVLPVDAKRRATSALQVLENAGRPELDRRGARPPVPKE